MLSANVVQSSFAKRVIAAGLDLDFRGEPFGIIPTLMAHADEVFKLKAICVSCGQDAHHTQRLINGKPAAYDDPVILVGASELYEARCRNCFTISKSSTTDSQELYAGSLFTKPSSPVAG